jgi:hypothetical protein
MYFYAYIYTFIYIKREDFLPVDPVDEREEECIERHEDDEADISESEISMMMMFT